ncbi:MAG: ankyrin repeat domain-containing protein [Planctomycetes bacterium]|nr:ankyrin repeat domain-containing protein [Planctomycetota bacterium]
MKWLYIELFTFSVLLTIIGCVSENEFQAKRYMALIDACEEDNLPKAVRLLQEGVEPNGKDVLDETPKSDAEYFAPLRNAPIVHAAMNGNIELVRILLEYGADPNWCCCSCVTALHEAILNEHADIVCLLLANAADVKINFDGRMSTLELAKQVGNEIVIQMIKEYSSM